MIEKDDASNGANGAHREVPYREIRFREPLLNPKNGKSEIRFLTTENADWYFAPDNPFVIAVMLWHDAKRQKCDLRMVPIANVLEIRTPDFVPSMLARSTPSLIIPRG